jgi:hypothetical protein
LKNTVYNPTKQTDSSRESDAQTRDRGRPRKFTLPQLVIVIVVTSGNAYGGLQIGKDSLRRILGVNLSTIKRRLRELLGFGWINRVQRRISRTYNRCNVYHLTIFAPQGLNINYKNRKTRTYDAKEAKIERSSYTRNYYEWKGQQMRRSRDQRNHPARPLERWKQNKKMKFWREGEQTRAGSMRMRARIGVYDPPQLPDIDAAQAEQIEAEEAAFWASYRATMDEANKARLDRLAVEAEARTRRLEDARRRDEEFIARNYGYGGVKK